ncbi:hypothetical protein F5Y19DRAFT_473359 [Xylariaceae sp. FL1651]|nr:hypothetical protein F5Y19DRAFT_473359 [Xylariaceae sp. FL1651]
MSSYSQSFSYSTYSSSTSTNGGPPRKTTYAERSFTDNSGTFTERMHQLPGQRPVYESTQQPSGRQVEGTGIVSVHNRITDVTDSDKVDLEDPSRSSNYGMPWFNCEGQPCVGPTYYYGLCRTHNELKVQTHDYYKDKEEEYKNLYEEGLEDNFPLLEEKHQCVLLAAAARILHRNMFFSNNQCEGHELYILNLLSRMRDIEYALFYRKKPFVIQGGSYDDMVWDTVDTLLKAVLAWHDAKEKKNLGDYVSDVPRLKVTGTKFPDSLIERRKPPICIKCPLGILALYPLRWYAKRNCDTTE